MTTRLKGSGSSKRSQVPNLHAWDAATLTGRIGLPVSCDNMTAPGLNSCTGPRGPSGVMAGEISCLTIVS